MLLSVVVWLLFLAGCGETDAVSGLVGQAGSDYIVVSGEAEDLVGFLLSEETEITWKDSDWENQSYGHLAGFQVTVVPGSKTTKQPDGYIPQDSEQKIPWYWAQVISVTGASDALNMILGE